MHKSPEEQQNIVDIMIALAKGGLWKFTMVA